MRSASTKSQTTDKEQHQVAAVATACFIVHPVLLTLSSTRFPPLLSYMWRKKKRELLTKEALNAPKEH